MKRIMFVCHGNICRSPMAEFILKDKVKKLNLQDEFYISSSATSTEEIWGNVGNPVYPPAREELKKHGITCEGKRAVQVKKEDYSKYDMFLVMDRFNLVNLLKIFGQDKDNKVKKLMSFCNEDSDVADPWYTGNFEITYNDIDRATDELLKELIK